MTRRALEPRLHCALCSGSDFETAIAFPDIPVQRCRACGFLFSGNVMPEELLGDFYLNRIAGRRHFIGQRLNAAMNFTVLHRLGNLRPGLSLLDVGCGYGFLLQRLRKELAAVVTGLEVSRREVSYARTQLHLEDVYNSRTAIPAQRRFDLVTCFGLIEHLREPVPFARQLLKRVTPGGRLVLRTDNFDSTVAREMGCAFPRWLPHAHLNHFTPATLRRCVSLAGSDDITFYSVTPWEMHLLAAWNRLRGAKSPADYFRLDDVLATEKDRPVRLLNLRRLANAVWVPWALRSHDQGSVLYAVVRPKTP